uniref:Ground-like domain-containing protein n=1 Tax=Panagrellus redivivus TaxID=6233 RepID=A0A7E4W1P8_PANRE
MLLDMRPSFTVTVFLICSCVSIVASQSYRKSTQLKTELLSNLNRHSDPSSGELELLGDSNKHSFETVEKADTTPEPKVPLPEFVNRFTTAVPPLSGFMNLFQPPSSFPGLTSLFNGILPIPLASTTAAPLPQMRIQPLPPFAAGFRQAPMTTPIPIPVTLPTLLPPFMIPNGVMEGNSDQFGSDNQDDRAGRPVFVNATSVTTTTTAAEPRKTLTDAVVENIRDWRQKFYKAFKKLKPKIKSESARITATTTTTEAPLDIQTLSPVPLHRPATNAIVIEDPNAAEVDKNKQVLNTRRNPNFLSEQKVKTFARDSKGRIVRLFGVESSGYRWNDTNTNGFIPLPEPPILPAQNIDVGPVYIPAARPTTAPPPGYGVSYSRYNTPAPAIDPVLANYVAAPLPAPPPSNVYTVKMPSPPAVAPIPPNPSDAHLTREVEAAEYSDEQSESEPEPEQPCDDCSPQQPSNDYYPESGITANGILENNEKCNSMRLRYIIEESIIEGDAETSKRTIQERAENEVGIFYNVICGTGFFSYIAHTDEFCQASSMGINCYVFSPVCSVRPEVMVSGIARRKLKAKKAMRRAVVNKN